MKRILITGDQGYIGGVLAPMLLKKNYAVVGYDADYFTSNKRFSYPRIKKDIRRIKEKDLRGVDVVIHLAALSNDPIGELNPILTQDINFRSSVRLAKLSKKMGVKRFIFSSSCSVYGNKFKTSVTEQDLVNPLTQYAKTKVLTERALLAMADDNFSPVILRNPTVYGRSPNMRLDLVVNNLVAWAMTSGKIVLLSDGRAWRPVIHISDLARVFMLIVDSPKTLIHNQIFLVGVNNQNYLIIDIAREIHRQLPKCQIVFANKRTRDRRSYKVDFAKFNNTFPRFKFKVGLSDGIRELIKFFLKTKLQLEDLESEKYSRIKGLKYLLDNHKIDKKLYWL